MTMNSRARKLFQMISLSPGALWKAFQVLPSYIFSVGLHKITASDLKRLFDLENNPVGATPIVSYVDWAERNKKAGLFNDYPSTREYQWIKEYPSKVDRIHHVIDFLQGTRHVQGDIAEFGVYKGHTAILVNRVRKSWAGNKKLHLFDSFEGLPDEIRKDDDFYAGQFSDTSVEKVRQVVGHDAEVNIVKGFFNDTLHTLPDLRFSFCHVDCDLEIAVLECLDYILPRLSFGGIIVFDDYGFRACAGLRRAVDEFFAKRGEKVIPLSTSQAVYINLGNSGSN